MPLIVRCETCQKFNLVEDEKRGKIVNCLNPKCKAPIPKPNVSAVVVVCPKPECNTKMQIPTNAVSSRLQCPKCGCVF